MDISRVPCFAVAEGRKDGTTRLDDPKLVMGKIQAEFLPERCSGDSLLSLAMIRSMTPPRTMRDAA